ncbi:unnamed protein product, partial [Phaeothamnion confervicola]
TATAGLGDVRTPSAPGQQLAGQRGQTATGGDGGEQKALPRVSVWDNPSPYLLCQVALPDAAVRALRSSQEWAVAALLTLAPDKSGQRRAQFCALGDKYRLLTGCKWSQHFSGSSSLRHFLLGYRGSVLRYEGGDTPLACDAAYVYLEDAAWALDVPALAEIFGPGGTVPVDPSNARK